MATSKTIAIAKAVTEELNGGSYTQSFTAARSYKRKIDLEELSSLRVTVIPESEEIDKQTRATTLDDFRVAVVVQKKIAVDSEGQKQTQEVDTLLDFTEELKNTFRFGDQMASATWMRTDHDPLYDQDKLDEFNVFESVFTLNYRIAR